jgi:hypothetical protein
MKKVMLVLLLVAASVAAQSQVIQDKKEHNAFVAAVNATDPAQKVQMMESYLQKYPNSVQKETVLELLTLTYVQLNNTAQVKASAESLLQVNSNSFIALAILSNLDLTRPHASESDAATALREAGQLGTRGLQALQNASKPERYTDDQWEMVKSPFRVTLQLSVGAAALHAKDYTTAQQNLREVVAARPNDGYSINLLALAYLSPKPIVVDGLFWIAKFAASYPIQVPYAKDQYVRYHGSADGFDELLASAKAAPTIPAGFAESLSVAPPKLPSTYVSAQTPGDQLQLNADYSMSLLEAGQAYHGTFVVKGSTLELNISETSTKTTLRREGDSLTDSSGQTWSHRDQSVGTAPIGVVLHNEDIIKLAKVGIDDATISAKIRSSKCQFDTSTDALVLLKKSGVSAVVLKAMVGAE